MTWKVIITQGKSIWNTKTFFEGELVSDESSLSIDDALDKTLDMLSDEILEDVEDES